ncbi:insulin-degrading enzyme [Culicoides brevitarsis]|uniref:insulin-degrading enzyme n=1 Tax=Culicoides brevitarsis TaxID=469753 RepID=UPI00307C31C3
MFNLFSARIVIRNCACSVRNRTITRIQSIHTYQNMGRKNDIMFSNNPAPNIASAKMTRFANILKSEQDSREYRGLVLDNGLKCVLISDPTTDKSAAAMSVEVGYLSDPENIPGLAHFCEHMLFLGTKKYPDENEYTSFLAANGGTSNAATYADMTKYYFEVVPDKLDDALDRFAHFFIDPLFTETATEREINAVDSEHEKNLTTDVWRIRQVNKELADPKHPYYKFGTGNKQTLCLTPKEQGIDVRKELFKFHEKWYSSNIMSLAILGKESLDELEDMVVQKFSPIMNKNIDHEVYDPKPYLNDRLGTLTSVVPIKDIRTLTISFQMPDLDKYYKSGPDHYVAHLIGHEGAGSILSELKKRGLSNNLMGGYSTSARGWGFFEITVDLTEKGYEKTDEIIKIIFQYINMLKKEGSQKWIFDEYCQISQMLFRFKDKENPLALVSGLVHAMQVYPLEEVLSAPYLVNQWRPELVEDLLSNMFPENARFILVGKKVADTANLTEKWYGTAYKHEKIANNKMREWTNCGTSEALKLPKPNPFIPTDFELLKYEGTSKFPSIIFDSPYIRVWHLQDNEFLKPKSCINIDLASPIVYSDPSNCNLTHLFVQLLRDDLNEYLYDAELAGLKFAVSNTTYGISIGISGYSEKQGILLEKVLENLFNFKIDPQRFEIIKEKYIRGLKNFKAEQPYSHAIYYLALMLTEVSWTKTELLEATEFLTVDRLNSFIKELLTRLHAECFIYGNFNKERTFGLTKIIQKHISATTTLPLNSRQLLLKREVKLNEGDSFLFETEHTQHKSNCTELYMQVGRQSEKNNVFTDLAVQIINEPCYNTLRTQEQLGYIVFCGTRRNCGAQGIRIIVQSNRHPAYVEERIETFLTSMKAQIEKMSDEEFEKHKTALAALKLEKPKRMSAQFSQYLNEISVQQYHFERSECEVAFLKKITKEEFIKFYENFLLPNSKGRRTLVIYITSTDCTEKAPASDTENQVEQQPIHTKIEDLATFKSTKELYPNVEPYIKILPKGAKSKL